MGLKPGIYSNSSSSLLVGEPRKKRPTRATVSEAPVDPLNSGFEDFGIASPTVSDTPDFVQFPQYYGLSQEQLSNDPNVDPLAINAAPTLSQLNNPNDMARWHANEKSKHEERTFIPRMAVDFVTKTNPGLIDEWKKQGEKGFVESAIEDPAEKIPFLGSAVKVANDLDVLGAMKRLGKNQYRDITTPRSLPTLGSGLAGLPFDSSTTTSTASQQKSKDESLLGDWLVVKAENEVRGQSIGGAIGAGISQMPSFMVEFAATGPGATVIRSAVKKSVSKVTQKILGKKIGAGLGKVSGFTAGAAARVVQAPQQVAKGTTEGLLQNTNAKLTDEGFRIDNSSTPAKELLKSTASTFIEMFSEQSGAAAKDIISRLIPNGVKKTFEKAFKRLNPNKKAAELWTKGGFDGFVLEMGEEELGEIMRVGFGLDSFEEFLENKTLRNYLIKGGIIGTVGGVGKVVSALPAPKKTIEQSEKDLSESLDRHPVNPVLIEKGEIDEKATNDALPEIEKGKVRMYRAESPTVSFHDIFNKDKLKDFAPDREGSFWTIDLDTANYFRNLYGKDAELTYVDVPKADATNFKVNGNDIEFVLSDDIFKKGNVPNQKEVTNVPEAQKVVPEKPIEPEVVKSTQKETAKEVPKVVAETVETQERAKVEPKSDVGLGAKVFLRETVGVPKNDPRFSRSKKVPHGNTTRNIIVQNDISEILPEGTESVFHETDFNNAKSLIARISQGRRGHGDISVSENIDLALGQKTEGYILEFDTKRVNGKKAPTLGGAIGSELGIGSEYLIDKTVARAIKSVTAPSRQGVEDLRKLKGMVKLLDFNKIEKVERGFKIPAKSLVQVESKTQRPARKPRPIEKKVEAPSKVIVSGRPTRTTPAKELPKTIKRIVREQRAATKLKIKSNLQPAKDLIQKELPLAIRGKAIAALKGATDAKGLKKVEETVGKLKSEFEHREAKESLTKTIKGLSGKGADNLFPEFREKVEGLTGDLSLKQTSERLLKKLKGKADAIEDDPLNFDAKTIQSTLDKLEGAGRTPIGDLPTQVLIELNDSLKLISKLNNLKGKLIFGKGVREIKEFTGKILSSLKSQKSLSKRADRTDPHRGFLLTNFWDNTLGPKETAQRIDDAESGAMKTIFYDNPKAQERKWLDFNHQALDIIMGAAEKVDLKWDSVELQNYSRHDAGVKKATKREVTLESGKKIVLSPAELIDLNLSLRDPRQQAEILKSGVVFEDFDITGPKLKITLKDIQTLKDKLTADETVFADTIFKWYNTESREMVTDTFRLLGGSRKLSDNYYPSTRSRNRTQEYGKITPKNFVQDLSEQSFFKERIDNKKPVVIRDAFVRFYQHADQVGKARHMMMPVRNMQMIMGNPLIKKELTRVYGKNNLDYWNDRTVFIVGMGARRTGGLEKGYNKLLTAFATSVLGWNPSPRLKQFGGLYPAASIIGPRVFSNYAKTAGKLDSIFKEFSSISPELRERYDIHGSHLVTQNLVDRRRLFGRRGIADKSLDGLQTSDKRVVAAIYLTAKENVKKNNPGLSESEIREKAVRKTESVVGDTQNITSILDMSKLALDSKEQPILKTTTMFKSNAERMQNMLRQATWRYQKSDKTIADTKKFINTTAAVMIGNAGHSVVTSKLLRTAITGGVVLAFGASGDDDLEKALSPEELFQTLPKEIIMENLGNLYFIGSLARMINDAFSGNFWWRNDLTGPVGDLTITAIDAAVNTSKAIEEGFSGAKGTKLATNAVFDAAQVALRLRGIPTFPLRVAEKSMKKLLNDTKSGSKSRSRRTRVTRKRKRRTR